MIGLKMGLAGLILSLAGSGLGSTLLSSGFPGSTVPGFESETTESAGYAPPQAGRLLELPANAVLPVPAPVSPPSAWLSEGIRQRLLESVSGVSLRGYRYVGSNPNAPTLLFFNGNGMTVLRADQLYRQLARLGPTVVVYDYRGFGFSNGTPDMMTFRKDGLQLFDRLAAVAPRHRVTVFGVSLGTAMAAYVASQRPVAGLILGMPIASAEEELPVYGRLLGYPDEQLAHAAPSEDAKAIFDGVGMVRQSKAPLLILHGTADDVVPIAQGREVLAASASPDKRMIEVQGAGHSAAVASPEAVLALAGFLQGLR